ncbi:MAG: helix-turn-helix transcriptional regulator, partial [Pseudomonadota bacterium]
AEFVEADSAIVMNFRALGDQRRRPFARGHVEINFDHTDQYINQYHRKDEVAASLIRIATDKGSAATRFYMLDEFNHDASYWHSDFFNQFLVHTGIRDFMALAVAPHNDVNEQVVFGFHRHDIEKPFTDQDKERAGLIAPVLTSTLSRIAFHDHVSRRDCALKELTCRRSDAGTILVFDDEGQLIHAEGGAAGLDESTFALADTVIAPEIAKLQSSDRTEIEFSPPCDYPNASAITLQRFHSTDLGTYFVAVVRPSHVGLPQHLSHRWNLSRRENQVATLLATGIKNAEIGAELGITGKTVENHLASIYAKSGLSGRAQFLSRLNSQ